jgi:hypothetical protein
MIQEGIETIVECSRQFRIWGRKPNVGFRDGYPEKLPTLAFPVYIVP